MTMPRSLALLAALSACGSDGSTADPDAGPTGDAVSGEYFRLITADWMLPPNTERYICATKTLTEDIYAGALRPIGPPGTHHTVISIGPSDGNDRPSFPCGPEFGQFWASGAGTGELVLPDGVGLLASAGQQLRLSLHLFNASDEMMMGTSGLEVRRLERSRVMHEASVSFHGPFAFSIPPSGAPHTATDMASLGDRTLVAIFPHMHQLGRHFRARIVGGGGPTTLWDEDYQFESQEFAPLPSVAVRAGDQLETTCTWVNATGSPVGWGDSSNAEMCFTILMSY
jgi:hypothetical protein